MNKKYKTTFGITYNQDQVERKMKLAKQAKLMMQRFEYGKTFCEDCLNEINETQIDFEFKRSMSYLIDNGQSEELWRTDNLRVLCFLKECRTN